MAPPDPCRSLVWRTRYWRPRECFLEASIGEQERAKLKNRSRWLLWLRGAWCCVRGPGWAQSTSFCGELRFGFGNAALYHKCVSLTSGKFINESRTNRTLRHSPTHVINPSRSSHVRKLGCFFVHLRVSCPFIWRYGGGTGTNHHRTTGRSLTGMVRVWLMPMPSLEVKAD